MSQKKRIRRLAAALAAAAGAVIVASASAHTTAATITIRHQTHGCHSWALSNGPSKAALSVTARSRRDLDRQEQRRHAAQARTDLRPRRADRHGQDGPRRRDRPRPLHEGGRLQVQDEGRRGLRVGLAHEDDGRGQRPPPDRHGSLNHPSSTGRRTSVRRPSPLLSARRRASDRGSSPLGCRAAPRPSGCRRRRAARRVAARGGGTRRTSGEEARAPGPARAGRHGRRSRSHSRPGDPRPAPACTVRTPPSRRPLPRRTRAWGRALLRPCTRGATRRSSAASRGRSTAAPPRRVAGRRPRRARERGRPWASGARPAAVSRSIVISER